MSGSARWALIVRRVGSHWCCAWQVMIALLLIGLVFSSGRGVPGAYGGVARYAMVEVLGDAAGALVLLAAALTVLRGRWERTQPVVVVALVWAGVGLVRGLVFAQFYPDGVARIVNSVISVPVWALVVIYVFATYDEGRANAGRLRAANADMLAVQDSTEELLERERARLVSALRDTIAAEIGRLRGLVASLSDPGARAEISSLADRVAAYSTDVVREVSRRLRSEEGVLLGVELAPGESRVALPSMGGSYLRARQPIVVPSILFALKALTVTAWRWEAAALARDLVAFALMAGVLWLGRTAIERWLRPPSVLEVSLSTALDVVAALVVVGSLSVTRRGGDDPSFVPLPTIAVFIVAVLILARIVAAVGQRWSDLSAELAAVNAQLAHANAQLVAQLLQVREQLAEVLHGPVQGRLAAASMSLRMYVDAGEHGRAANLPEAVAATVTLLDRATVDLEQLSHPQVHRWATVPDGLANVVASWAGLVTVRWAIDDGWQRDPDLVDGIVEMAAELVTNASRHGGARSVHIDVRGLSADEVEVAAVDDGRGPAVTATAGQGLGAVAKWNGSWAIARTGDGCTRVAVRLRRSAQLTDDAQ